MSNEDNDLYKRALALRLYGISEYFDTLKDESWLPDLLEREEQERSKRSLNRRMQHAHLGRFKMLSNFDWGWPRHCDRNHIESCLELNFIDEVTNIVLCGPNGVGKSTIACNIAHQAIMDGYTAYFTTASDLLNDLIMQETDRTLRKRLQKYIRPTILVIDEIGYLSYSNRHADLLFEVISKRYQEKPTIITSNKPFAQWNDIFPNASCVVSMVDRLVHKSEIISIDADSYRLKEAKEKAKKSNSAEQQDLLNEIADTDISVNKKTNQEDKENANQSR